MMQSQVPSTSASMSTAAPVGCLITQRRLGDDILVSVLSEVPHGLERLLGWWDYTQMVKDELIRRVVWATSAAAARYIRRSGLSPRELIFHGGGQGHQWLDPNFAAFLAAQKNSPRFMDFAGVSDCICRRSVKLESLLACQQVTTVLCLQSLVD
jgi:hypothetical protein